MENQRSSIIINLHLLCLQVSHSVCVCVCVCVCEERQERRRIGVSGGVRGEEGGAGAHSSLVGEE